MKDRSQHKRTLLPRRSLPAPDRSIKQPGLQSRRRRVCYSNVCCKRCVCCADCRARCGHVGLAPLCVHQHNLVLITHASAPNKNTQSQINQTPCSTTRAVFVRSAPSSFLLSMAIAILFLSFLLPFSVLLICP